MSLPVILMETRAASEERHPETGVVPVEQFPQFEYSKGEVDRAGRALAGELLWTPESEEEIRKVFQVANSWRLAHAFPLNRIRAELHGSMGRLKVKGITAARLKRMPSVRGKLQRLSSNLSRIQDLGGCRAVVPSIEGVRRLVDALKARGAHTLVREDAYMDTPRESGYRSHHLIFSFNPRGPDEAAYEGRKIEVQIRTRLQHSWATCVEAVGLYKGEDLKSSAGNADWLRLFRLMSEEMALTEGCDSGEERGPRIKEIIQLSGDLEAIQTLETLSHAVSDSKRRILPLNFSPKYCLISYNHSTFKVSVEYFESPSEASRAYSTAEQKDPQGNANAVLVEFDKIENLKKAYPNYFGDVQLFKNNLSKLVQGRQLSEYSLPPIERVPPPPKATPDDAWLRQPHHRRWTEPPARGGGGKPPGKKRWE